MAVEQDTPKPTPEAIPTLTSTPQAEPTQSPTFTETDNLTVGNFPDPTAYTWELVASGFQSPIGLVNAGDGSSRLFVIEQAGQLRIIQGGEVLSTPFLDIRDHIGPPANEQGLLGLAFHPRYQENGFFYVNYTDTNGNTVIARFTVSAEDPNRADPDSELRLLYIQQPYRNHNGGAVVFGPDGYLYLGLGDGGSGGDPQGNGQSTSSLLGSILRIDVDQGEPYAIPADNPFVSGGGAPEIWAYGLRNPWRFSFDRLTGDLYIGDVGQNAWEEINFLANGSTPGANFGWNYREGSRPYTGASPANVALIDPVAEYDHSQGCSVTGGYVYRGIKMPEWVGIYLMGDFCSGKLWGLLPAAGGQWQNSLLFETGIMITSFGEDESGEIYIVDRSGGIYRLRPVP